VGGDTGTLAAAFLLRDVGLAVGRNTVFDAGDRSGRATPRRAAACTVGAR
jgi:hypothetical protein